MILVSTTSQPPNDPPTYHDQFKIPIPNWRKCGLFKPSWGLGFRLLALNKNDFAKDIKDKDFIGKMPPRDLQYLIHQVELMHKD